MSAQALAAGANSSKKTFFFHFRLILIFFRCRSFSTHFKRTNLARKNSIAINTDPYPITQEHLLAWRIPCPKFDLLFGEQQQSAELKLILEKHRSSIEFWEKNMGAKLNGTIDIMYLHDTLYVENRRGLP